MMHWSFVWSSEVRGPYLVRVQTEEKKRYVSFLCKYYNSRINHTNWPSSCPGTSRHTASISCDQHQSYSPLGSLCCAAGTMQRFWKSTLGVLSARYFSSRTCRPSFPPDFSPDPQDLHYCYLKHPKSRHWPLQPWKRSVWPSKWRGSLYFFSADAPPPTLGSGSTFRHPLGSPIPSPSLFP